MLYYSNADMLKKNTKIVTGVHAELRDQVQKRPWLRTVLESLYKHMVLMSPATSSEDKDMYRGVTTYRSSTVVPTAFPRFSFHTSDSLCHSWSPVGQIDDEWVFNESSERPQLFAMLDACAQLWSRRTFFNPAEGGRPASGSKYGAVDNMHYWTRTLVEAFVVARQNHQRGFTGTTVCYEFDVKEKPKRHFHTDLIGALCDDSFKRFFQLLPESDPMRDMIRKVRSLNVLWGTLPNCVSKKNASGGVDRLAWMPLSVAHTRHLYESVGLYDDTNRMPWNVWNMGSARRVFHQSYHNSYRVSRSDPDFCSWVEKYVKYDPQDNGNCGKPFSRYGGTLVSADFIPHKVDRPTKDKDVRHGILAQPFRQ